MNQIPKIRDQNQNEIKTLGKEINGINGYDLDFENQIEEN